MYIFQSKTPRTQNKDIKYSNGDKKIYSQPKFTFKNYDLAFIIREIMYSKIIVFDRNKDMNFDEAEIKQFLVTILHQNPTEIQYFIKNVFRYDVNSDGIITYDELVNFCMEQHFGEIAIQRLHRKKIYHMGQKRIMNQPQFYQTIRYALSFIDFQLNPQYLESIFESIDMDKDEFISYEDYFRFLKQYFGSKSLASNLVNTETVLIEVKEQSLMCKKTSQNSELSKQYSKNIINKYKKYASIDERGNSPIRDQLERALSIRQQSKLPIKQFILDKNPKQNITDSQMNQAQNSLDTSNLTERSQNQTGNKFNQINILTIGNNRNALNPTQINFSRVNAGVKNGQSDQINSSSGDSLGSKVVIQKSPVQNSPKSSANKQINKSNNETLVDQKRINQISDQSLNFTQIKSENEIVKFKKQPQLINNEIKRVQELRLQNKQKIKQIVNNILRLVYSQLRVEIMNYDFDFDFLLASQQLLPIIKRLTSFDVSINEIGSTKEGGGLDKKYTYQQSMKILIKIQIKKIFEKYKDKKPFLNQQQFVNLIQSCCRIVPALSMRSKFRQLYNIYKNEENILTIGSTQQFLQNLFSSYGFQDDNQY